MPTMPRTHITPLLLILGALLTVATQAMAEATLTYNANGKTNHIYLCGDTVFFEDGSSHVMMYDSKRKVMGTVDHGKKEYMEISEGDLEAIGSQVSDAMAMAQEKMAEAMKNMTPQQQEAMKNAMGSMIQNPEDVADVTYEAKSLGKKQTINSFPCEGYAVLKNGEPHGEVWVTSLDNVKLSEKDLEPIGALAQFVSQGMQKALGRAPQTDMLGFLDPHGDSFVGLPVRFTDEDGVESELVSVETGEVDRTGLQPGSGYTKRDMMEGLKNAR